MIGVIKLISSFERCVLTLSLGTFEKVLNLLLSRFGDSEVHYEEFAWYVLSLCASLGKLPVGPSIV